MEKCGVFGLFIVDDVFSGQNQGIVPDFERMSQNIKFVVGRKVANDVFFKGIKSVQVIVFSVILRSPPYEADNSGSSTKYNI